MHVITYRHTIKNREQDAILIVFCQWLHDYTQINFKWKDKHKVHLFHDKHVSYPDPITVTYWLPLYIFFYNE